MKGLKAFLKFVPVFVLAGLMIFGKGHLFDGQDAMIAAPLAFLAAVIIAMLVEKKIIRKELDGLKVLGNGELTKKLTVKAVKFTGSAKEKIEAVGGTAEVI